MMTVSAKKARMNCHSTFAACLIVFLAATVMSTASAFVVSPFRVVSTGHPAATVAAPFPMRLYSSASNTTSSNNTTKTPSMEDAMDDLGDAAKNMWEKIRDAPERYRIKQELIQMGASYDRGFGASPSAREKVKDMVKELQDMNPCDNASVNIDGYHADDENESPLKGNWRLVWTTAQDVLVLNGSPFTAVGAIHQVIEPPVITNIIDIVPRYQSLLPPDKIPSTLVRAKVKTKASSKSDPMRIGLTFESVNVKALEVLGQKMGSSLPALAFDLPKLPGTAQSESQRYFDVIYLDRDMLIIKQNAPGGTIVLVRVDDAEP